METVRRADLGDLDQLLDLVAAFYEIDGHAYEPGRVRDALQPLLTDDRHGQVWVLGTDGCSGYAVVTWSWSLESGGRDAILDEIYVHDRGRGAGTRLLRHAAAAAAAAGARVIYLETESSNERVRRFYARQGFVTDDSIWMSAELSNRGSSPTRDLEPDPG